VGLAIEQDQVLEVVPVRVAHDVNAEAGAQRLREGVVRQPGRGERVGERDHLVLADLAPWMSTRPTPGIPAIAGRIV
jgi:hypothetical protein